MKKTVIGAKFLIHKSTKIYSYEEDSHWSKVLGS